MSKCVFRQSVVAHDVDHPSRRKSGEVSARFVGLAELAERLAPAD
jgi:hypothetical protein